jgi:putative ABC transport system permease protein
VPLSIGRVDWKQPDGTIRTLEVFGIDPRSRTFRNAEIEAARPALAMAQTALIDRGTRNVPPALFASIAAGEPYRIEAGARRIDLIGTFAIGGGFGADGYAVVSDQTFLRLFRNRSAGAPNLILVRAEPGVPAELLAARLAAALPERDVVVRGIEQAAAFDQRFQTTQRPVGMVFGFGILIGMLVGLVLVQQVLATDVNDHLREYATMKAMGYRQRFLLGIVFEEAAVLAFLGFLPGLVGALGLYAAVNALTGLPIAMTGTRAATVLIGTFVVCAISGALATRRLARADPAELF